MKHAIQDGIKYANGGRCLKHVGIPCITIPMGVMQDKQMPVGVTFATKAFDDSNLLYYAYLTVPPSTPALGTDKISLVKLIIKIGSQIWTKSEDPENHLRTLWIPCRFLLMENCAQSLLSITAESRNGVRMSHDESSMNDVSLHWHPCRSITFLLWLLLVWSMEGR
ncbi:unnamed protein product [Clonostachys rhizophaga]|uniref:Amidase domain-containing protein n=1 Tax=Clonostachys rhizophaga TaxID=160324 RepID=A0A9N9Y932_9HYPO|nr:unnamed protein product [Clonostachys rhizophaga]